MYVSVPGGQSESVDCPSGVPQGSVLGPLLFIIYMNDLPDVVTHSRILMYADDIKLFLPVNSEIDHNLLQHDLDAVSTWCMQWQLKPNPKKCVVLQLKKCDVTKANVLNNVNLGFVDHVKDLGVHVCKNLDFSMHCNAIAASAHSRLYLILRSFISRDRQFLVKMYKTFVSPILEYASPALVSV